jgi:hypothetical protein
MPNMPVGMGTAMVRMIVMMVVVHGACNSTKVVSVKAIQAKESEYYYGGQQRSAI